VFVGHNVAKLFTIMRDAIMLERQYGPREINPESMWTGLTRQSATMPSWQGAQSRAMQGFETSDSGVWLPKLEHSEDDLEKLTALVSENPEKLMLDGYKLKRVARALGRMSINAQGCWVDSSRASLSDLAEADIGNKILEKRMHFDELRQCDTQDCKYHRHYDLTSGVPSGRRELLYPNLQYFLNTGDEVITAWGDTLPAVEASRENLKAFQKLSMPWADSSNSLLTVSGISQINLIPATGCWFARCYYMTPVGVGGYESWQYDGYSRLKIPSPIADRYGYVKFAILGHRVVWLLSGNKLADPKKEILNHKCGFRPCVNPDHMEQIPQDDNVMHGRLMMVCRAMIKGSLAQDEGVSYLKSRNNADAVERFWAEKD
jgi:hypothetical protein